MKVKQEKLGTVDVASGVRSDTPPRIGKIEIHRCSATPDDAARDADELEGDPGEVVNQLVSEASMRSRTFVRCARSARSLLCETLGSSSAAFGGSQKPV